VAATACRILLGFRRDDPAIAAPGSPGMYADAVLKLL
jgi:hypothetical protein